MTTLLYDIVVQLLLMLKLLLIVEPLALNGSLFM